MNSAASRWAAPEHTAELKSLQQQRNQVPENISALVAEPVSEQQRKSILAALIAMIEC